ncbi:MAG: PepSY domain-containing protein [Rubrimonas sp.]
MNLSRIVLGAALSLGLSAPAFADRPPTEEERAQLEAALRELGFTSWGNIEFEDDGVWEIDDAIAADGRKYELILTPTFEILEQNAD